MTNRLRSPGLGFSTPLSLGTVPSDGQFLKRDGTTITGAAVTSTANPVTTRVFVLSASQCTGGSRTKQFTLYTKTSTAGIENIRIKHGSSRLLWPGASFSVSVGKSGSAADLIALTDISSVSTSNYYVDATLATKWAAPSGGVTKLGDASGNFAPGKQAYVGLANTIIIEIDVGAGSTTGQLVAGGGSLIIEIVESDMSTTTAVT